MSPTAEMIITEEEQVKPKLVWSAPQAAPVLPAVKETHRNAEIKKQTQGQHAPFSRTLVEPITSLKKGGFPRPNIKAAAIALLFVGAGAIGFLFVRESVLRRQAMTQLTKTEQARAGLEQSVSQLRIDVSHQKEEISRLVTELESANKKAAEVEQIRSKHEAELADMKKLYEGQIGELKKTLEDREGFIVSLQNSIQSLKERLEAPSQEAASIQGAAAEPSAVSVPIARTAGERPASGKILMIDEKHRFIVVNIGPAQGAASGRFVQVYQGGQPLGQARIDRVYQNLCAATVVGEDVLKRARKGDLVFLTTFS